MGIIRAFAADATDFSSMGLGVLGPISCVIHEKLNGDYSLTMEHPLDGVKSEWLQLENIVVSPVPAGTSPDVGGTAGTVADRLIYKISTSGKNLRLRKGPGMGYKILGSYKTGKKVTVTDTSNGTWFKVVAPDGAKGYMYASYLTYVRTDVSAKEAPSVEPHANRPQPFRIYKIVPDMNTIHVYARHIFYDLADNMVLKYKKKDVTGATALSGILAGARDAHDFAGYSDMTDADDADDIEIVRASPSEAILGDGGLIDTFGGELYRDWYDVYVVSKLGGDGGVTILYGKNLLQIGGYFNLEKAVTRIIPVGADADGNDLYLPEVYIEADDADDFDHPRYGVLEVPKADMSGGMTQSKAYTKMRRAANKQFDAGAAGVDISFTVDFVHLPDTVEYAEFADLEYVHPFDTVRLHHARAGVDFSIRMTEYEYDALGEGYESATFGSVQAALETTSISPKLIDSGSISGAKLVRGSVGNASLGDGVINARAVAAGAIVAGAIAADAVTAEKIKAGAVEAEKIKAGAIEADHIKAGAVTAEKIKAGAVEADHIKAGAVTAGKIAAEAIEAGNIKAGTITANQCVTGLITADSGLISNGAIKKAMIGEAQIVAAHIQSINADVIETGTLSVKRLLLVGENGVVHQINAQSGGLTASELTEEKYKKYLNGSVIVAKSVTADQIAGKTITANEILANSITAAEIDVAQFFGAAAVINSMRTAVIRNIPVGGRNLLRGTTKDYKDYIVGKYYMPLTELVPIIDLGLAPGDTVTLSMFIDNTQTAQKGLCARFDTYSSTSGADKVSISTGAQTIAAGANGKSVITGVIPDTAVYIQIDLNSTSREITIDTPARVKCVKLEYGEVATDWTPSPDEVIIGSTIELTESRTRITTPEFSVDVEGTNGDMHVGPDGVIVDRIVSESVCSRYTGPGTLYVNKSATDTQVEAGNYFRSVSAAVAVLNGRCLTRDVTINIADNDYYESSLDLKYISGGGRVALNGNGGSIVGSQFRILWCSCGVFINNLTITQRSNNETVLYIESSQFTKLEYCVFSALSSTTIGDLVSFFRGSTGQVEHCEFYDAPFAITARDGSTVGSYNNKGNCNLRPYYGMILACGTQPCADTTFTYTRYGGGTVITEGGVTVDQGAATPPEPETITDTFNATTAHTVYGSAEWPGSWKSDTNYTWQGYTTGMKHQATMLWFSGLSALSGKTILSAKLKIKRVAGIGKGDEVKVIGYYGEKAYNAGSGSPNPRTSMGTLGRISNGETAEFTIPAAAISYLVENPAKYCIALNPGDDSVLSGKVYSSNYCKFYGMSGTKPQLEVTYK